MSQSILLAIDIGATSVKTGAFSLEGKLLSVKSAPNGPKSQPDSPPEWRIWDVDEIWQSICQCSKAVMAMLDNPEVRGIAVTGFGADGVPMKKEGTILYPCISWHCSRTAAQSAQVAETIDAKDLYRITGYHNYPINTFNRFLWLKENAPQALDNADYWLHVQDYIVYKLTGEFSTECTIASTEMSLDLLKRNWSKQLFDQFGLTTDFLSPLHESGSIVGTVTTEASQQSGIPIGSNVVTGGHDTEMAIIGAGINSPETFLDINGTWEILMAVTNKCSPSNEDFSSGLDWECHAIPGWWNCQALMIAGGVIEWIRNQFYRDQTDAYSIMMAEAEQSPLGSNNLAIIPAFVRGMGPSQAYDPSGAILGITTQTNREDIARATFECLSYQFYQQIEAIERSFGVHAQSVRVTGGGQKNPFWMQMKADISGRALDVLQDIESTMLGAAILAGIGSGVYAGLDEALQTVHIPTELVVPDMSRHQQYKERYQSVVSKLPPQMETAFQTIHSKS